MYRTLEIDIAGRVATIWMNRPEIHNAFDDILIDDLVRACQAMDRDTAVRVVVLAGRGKSFSAGADVNWMQKAVTRTGDENLRDARALAGMLRTLAELRKPTVARVHGAAVGGGMGLIAACDIAIASTAAYFATSEVRLGVIPAAISPYILRAIGARQAYRYFLTAERIDARHAREIGLVHEAVAPEALDDRMGEITATLLRGSPVAQSSAKELIRAVDHQPFNQGLIDDTAHRLTRLWPTAEAQEGIKAFLEKRQPDWDRDR